MVKRWLRLFMAATMLAGLVPLSASALDPVDLGYPRGVEFPVALGDNGQIQPDIGFPWLVWKDMRDEVDSNGENAIYAFNFATGEEVQVSDLPGSESNPSVSGDWVVYSHDTSDTVSGIDGYCGVYASNLVTGETKVLNEEWGYNQGNPAIDGDIVVHNRWDNVAAVYDCDIWGYDLSDDTTFAITLPDNHQFESEIGDGWVVFKDVPHSWGSNYSVGAYNLESAEATIIAQSYYNSGTDYVNFSDPSTDDGKVVYKKYGYWNAAYGEAIMLYDLSTSTETTLSTVSHESYRRHPVIKDGLVSWHDNRAGAYEVFVYDLATQEETCVVPAVWDADLSAWTQYAGRTTTGGGFIAWHDHRTELDEFDAPINNDGLSSSDLYAMSLNKEAIPFAGADRFATAVAISEEAFPAGADTVVIATARNWPDALGGTALAGAIGCPVLLTDTNTLPESVLDEIDRLGATSAIILGGTSAVGENVEAALETAFGEEGVDRLAGASRYETADIVAAATIAILDVDYDGTAFVTTGRNFPDALAAAPLAAAQGWPLFLAHPTAGLSDDTKLAMIDVDTALILGGTSAVATTVEDELVDELGETYAVEEAGHTWNYVAIATGTNFPDALAGGVLQGQSNSVMLLTTKDTLAPATGAALSANKLEITTVRFLGGTNAVAQSVRDAVMDAIAN
ncbi:MAG: hypothetical protein CVT69_01720 [Actinobacteria bacterium HGW-Actinobacteria-9]|nr:MAG: hypothetical protein CVT69_01720 [Actinobacteria bacterium HGW-Actinobacteria-9]